MELQYFGANCIKLTTKKVTITIDDNLADLGAKSVTKAGDISLFTGAHGDVSAESKITIDKPGEYEVSNISIQGVPARSHLNEEGKYGATIYKLLVEDLRIAIVGHIYPALSSSQLEAIGIVDILIIPVGGSGYTLDPVGALKVIKDIEPKLIIPTHYEDASLNYPVPQQSLEEALKTLAVEPHETTAKLKVKAGEFGEGNKLVVLERQ